MNKDRAPQPSLFHYDTSSFKTNPEDNVEANRITGITYTSPSSITATFEKDLQVHSLSSYATWMSKWKNRGMIDPEKECSLQKSSSGLSYQLSCSGSVVQERINI